MTSTNADYDRYVSEVHATVEREANHSRLLQAAREAGTAEVDAALKDQRTAAAALKNLDSSLRHLRPSVNQLVARASVSLNATTEPLSFSGPDQFEREVKGLTAELRGAEQSWQWVEKARREHAQQVAITVGSSDSVQLSIGGTSVAEPPGDASWNRRLVIGLSAAVAVALAVVLILLT